ncbi:MAG: ABC transporter substrate-binding protein [Gammaproteobacteria bacterium]|nr:ABC transporter substrate-binding protein [Gammaproteobacteria bacterium]
MSRSISYKLLCALPTSALVTGLVLGAANAQAETVKVGVLLGFTGPIESLTPPMASAAEHAFKEASDSGELLGGTTIEAVRADSTCVDAGGATAAAERLVTSDNVVAIMGADCSGVTIAVTNNVAVANGLPMVSPSATSPALTTIEDNGLFFRTAPSDARQGVVLTDILMDRDVKEVAVTYTNNDYGKGLSDAFTTAYEAAGGSVAITAAHEDGKADYSAEVAALSASGAEHLVVLGYVDQGGKGIIQASLDTDAFSNFYGGDGMVGNSIIEALGEGVEGMVTSLPGIDSDGANMLPDVLKPSGIEIGPFVPESYDAAALIVLAMQKAGKADRAGIAGAIMDVANAPGEPILPGELAKGLKILSEGGDIDYVGATNVELTDVGETKGSYKEQVIKGGKYEVVNYR